MFSHQREVYRIDSKQSPVVGMLRAAHASVLRRSGSSATSQSQPFMAMKSISNYHGLPSEFTKSTDFIGEFACDWISDGVWNRFLWLRL
jgi:hypothetical protein